MYDMITNITYNSQFKMKVIKTMSGYIIIGYSIIITMGVLNPTGQRMEVL